MARKYQERESLRILLLPIQEGFEERALAKSIEKATALAVAEDDFSYFLIIESQKWKDEKKISRELSEIVKAALSVNKGEHNKLLREKYFDIHKVLISEFFMDHDQASAFLSHSQLAMNLALEFKMASSQIANVLLGIDNRVPFCRPSVNKLLSVLKIKPEVTEAQVNDIFNSDRFLSEQFYADANLDGCISILGQMAVRFGLNSKFKSHFMTLLLRDKFIRHLKYIPYLQILHYQCTMAEVFDIDIKDLYEFSPRGVAALTLFNRYPTSIAGAGNPVLNNAKSVEQITESWVRSKKPPQRPGARALFNILDGLQSLGFSARKELCSAIRMWIHRVISEFSSTPVEIPNSLSKAQIEQLKSCVISGNTETSGVMEQRIVDVVASAIHADKKLWRSRGLLDAVNTTNISQKKLGDCDFQDSNNKVVVAYEAHGGKLTQVYLDEHIRTLKKILPYRISEWKSFSDINGWTVNVIFVAHDLSDEIKPINENIDQVDIKVDFMLFSDFFDKVQDIDLSLLITEFLLEPLSEARVPESVREKLLNIVKF